MSERADRIRRLFAALRESFSSAEPQNLPEPSPEELEAKWLSCVLTSPRLWSEGKLPLDAFQTPAHRLIFEAMATLRQEGVRCNDGPKLAALLSQRGIGQQQTAELLSNIMAAGGDYVSFDYYVQALRDRLAARDQAEDAAGERYVGNGEIVRLELGDGSPFQEFTTAELLAQQEPPEWLIPGVLLRHEPGVICGPSKTLKSSLAVDLGGALASGGQFLGQFAAERAFRVGFVSGASHRRALTDLAQRWNESREAEPQLVWSLAGDNLTEPKNLKHLRDWIARHQLEVVLIDPLQLPALTKRAQATQLQTLVRTCLESGATPIICCQTRKSIRPRALDVTDMASAACDGFARQWLLVNRRQNYEPGSGTHRLWLTIGGDAGQDGQWGVDICEGDFRKRTWTTSVRGLEELRDEAAVREADALQDRLERKIRRAFGNLAGLPKITKTHVRDQCGMNGVKFAAAWDRMYAAGQIAMDPNTPLVTSFHGYHLTDTADMKKNEPVRSDRAEGASAMRTNAPPQKQPTKRASPTVRPEDSTPNSGSNENETVRSDVAVKEFETVQSSAAVNEFETFESGAQVEEFETVRSEFQSPEGAPLKQPRVKEPQATRPWGKPR